VQLAQRPQHPCAIEALPLTMLTKAHEVIIVGTRPRRSAKREGGAAAGLECYLHPQSAQLCPCTEDSFVIAGLFPASVTVRGLQYRRLSDASVSSTHFARSRTFAAGSNGGLGEPVNSRDLPAGAFFT
jgi:hypothetical protein